MAVRRVALYPKPEIDLPIGHKIDRRLDREVMMRRMPVIFIGHGNPLNAITESRYSREWRAIGEALPRPRAILAISAHWYINGLAVTSMESPRTIHDFGGFPPELYAVQYPAPGSPALAHEVQALLAPHPVAPDIHWGLDHGTWSILCHLYPKADIPVVQLSLDRRQRGAFHLEIGRALAPLREEGVLILGSGNLIHNLQTYRWNDPAGPTFTWAINFEQWARAAILQRDFARLANLEALGSEGRLAIPTAEHYLPLLSVLGASDVTDQIDFPVEGFEGGSISMLAVKCEAV